jgi:prevent-host-death family protein
MRTIAHRELRNESSKILDEVSKGGVIQVTNHGEVVALIVPPATSRHDLLVAAGQIRPGAHTDQPWSAIPAAGLEQDSIDVLDELRS